jgi:cytochrome oxidase Cu insertion factor (SCO1/SenC/PrrC family)
VKRASLALTLLLAACSSDPSLPSYGVVPDFVLTDQSNRTFESKKRLDGKIWVANFIFTTCSGPCPRMTAQFRKLRDEVSDDPKLRMVSFTIDPARDTPEALATYGRNFGANPDKWFFLTGAQKDLHQLSRHAFMLGDIDGSLEHSSRFVLVDTQSRIRGFYDSSDTEAMQKLTTDLRSLLQGVS